MAKLDPAFEQQLAELSDDDWRSLTARVRPPTSSGQLREMAGKVLNADQLETFMSAVNPRAFVGENGDVDEARLAGHLTTLFGIEKPPQETSQPHQWGQHSVAGGPSKRVGDDARAALEKRHSVKNDSGPQFDRGIRAGDNARAALERRYGRNQK
jgi:hypothetical protein